MDPNKNHSDPAAEAPAATNGAALPPPAVKAPPAPPTPDPAECRARLVDALFGEQRPRPAALAAALQAYLEVLPDAAAEAGQLLALVRERDDAAGHAAASVAERFAQGGREQAEVYDQLFAELETLLQAIADELGRLREDTEAFQKAPEPLTAALRNHKKGLEIIERMARRLKERKKPLPAPSPLPAVEPLAVPEAPLAEFMPALVRAYHDRRDAATGACLQARQAVEDGKKEVLNVVKGILGAVDGVDGGLRSEAEVKARLEPYRAGHGALIDAWFAAYHALGQACDRFFAATGLDPQTAPAGTPFDPVRMEPAGTVADPNLKNEDVATVLRRGFSFRGEPVRPMLVEVVINAPAPAE